MSETNVTPTFLWCRRQNVDNICQQVWTGGYAKRILASYSGVDPSQNSRVRARVPRTIRESTHSRPNSVSHYTVRRGWKGNYTSLYRNTICTNVQNKQKLWGYVHISVYSAAYFERSVPRLPPDPGSTLLMSNTRINYYYCYCSTLVVVYSSVWQTLELTTLSPLRVSVKYS